MTQHDVLPDCTFCADASIAIGEQLFATAPRGDVWLLLEYTGAWGAKVLPQSDLSQPIKERLNAWTAAVPNSKLIFIRQGNDVGDTLSLYIAVSSELNPTLYHLRLSNYDDLLGIDLESLANRDPRFDAYCTDESLYLICINGRRDVSCTKYGVPLYQAVAEHVGEAAWQASHVGGHRFAANIVCLPSGACYGRVSADDASDLIAANQRGELSLEYLRGRSCYDAVVQAADYFLRAAEGISDVHALKWQDTRDGGGAQYTVRFESQHGRIYAVTVRRELSEWVTCENSGETPSKHQPQYHLVGYQSEE